ncbi:tom1-like protein 2 [Phtheirospermum japonicum]|uniref:Tom1-like protein 2 n=1 Tax=Phtheirospermum japonicum TaxID=374723 RepID=A0A830CEU4_9LAMI|nr:tom1-like protein 2 [Phtheirospermum japonicum]
MNGVWLAILGKPVTIAGAAIDPQGILTMASDLVSSATSDKLTEMDWTKNIEICELVARDHKQAKDVVKAIKKRLASKHASTQLFSVALLEMLINNIGDPVHKQVIDTGILPMLVKIVKKKSDQSVREKIFLLLDSAQTSVGGASGRFPQYYSAYYELVSAGVQFPQRANDIPEPHSTLNVNKNSPPDKKSTAPQSERIAPQSQTQTVSESSILQKAGTALEVLRDVLNTIDTQHTEGAKDEFTLDLVEQCSFQKQRVMHLAITSRDEKLVLRAIELNEQLERVLRRHDALVSGRTMSTSNHIDHVQEEEEEEPEQLFRRIRKGKACVRPEDENRHIDRPLGLIGLPVPGEMIHRPLIRPLTVERQRETIRPPITEPKQETIRPLHLSPNQEANLSSKPAVAIPPPPAKHVEREKFFQENKTDGLTLNGHIRDLSLHSRNASSSRSGSMDFSD